MKKMMRKILFVFLISLLFSTMQNSFAGDVKNNEITKINGVISDYSIVRKSYDKNSKEKDIGIFFPQINGLQDKTKQNKINRIIKDNALFECQEGINMYDYYDLDYTVMWSSNKLLSIAFTGDSYVKTAAHPNNIFCTVNIDMKTGKKIILPDFINVNNDFMKQFIKKSQFLADPIYLTADELSELKEYQFNIDNLQYDFDKNACFYFTSTGVVFSINTGHAIGDYLLFSLQYSELSNYIKHNAVWDNIKAEFPSTSYQVIREQCFKTNLSSFGDTWFISGFNNSLNGIMKGFKFYLIDKNGKVKYTFPKLFSNNFGYYGISAVSFRDVNHDGKKDIIIVTNVNSNKETEVDEAGVYLYNNNSFIIDNKLNTYINTNLKESKTVSDILKATQSYYKKR